MIKVYPAIFHEEDGYWVEYPDLPGCFSDGKSLEDTMLSAADALGLHLAVMLESGDPLPPPTPIGKINTKDGFVSYVSIDVARFLRRNKAVKKTLSIPQWLNDEAEKRGLNFSRLLQEALIKAVQ